MHGLKDARVVWTVVIAIAALLAFTSLLDTAVNLGMQPINRKCDSYLKGWTRQALTTAGTAGLMNAGLSVIEDSELQLEPGGVGASVALGDLVRPVNDMASKVLYVALASAVSLEIQQKLIEIGASIGLRWFFAASMLFLGLAVWFDASIFRRLAWGLFVLALVARFLIPGAVFITGAIGDQLKENGYEQTQAQFARLQSEATKTKDQVIDAIPTGGEVVASLNPFSKDQQRPSPDKLRGQLLALLDRFAKMRVAVGNLAVTLIAVFILQTILMPLFILWVLIKLPGYLLGPSGIEVAGERFLTVLRGGRKPIGGSPQIQQQASGARS